MTLDSVVAELAHDIRNLYAQNPSDASRLIENNLRQCLGRYTAQQGRDIIRQLIERFSAPAEPTASVDAQDMTRVFSLFLRRKVEPEDLSSAVFLERLAQSLNTIFDALNQLIKVINLSFSGCDQSGEQTIRQFIRYYLEGSDQTTSLEDYIGQINHAFLMTHDAFKNAAHSKVSQILRAIDPNGLSAERSSGLKIGPLRKAEDFDILKDKIERIRKWFESGRFMEDFLREFEKNCKEFDRKDRKQGGRSHVS